MKISVIVPVYNTEKYLNQCLDSIINQTFKDVEIILVDDSSTDNSLSILKSYANNDNRIKVIEHTHSGEGASSARNVGLALAKGEYLLFLDSDDYFCLDMFEKIYEKALQTDADIVMFDAEIFDDNNNAKISTNMFLNYTYLPKKEVFNSNDFPNEVFLSNLPVVWSKLFKRDFIKIEKLYFQSIYHTDDILFVSGAMALAKKITIIPEVFVYYRMQHLGSQATNKESSPLSMVHACIAMKEQLKEKGIFEKLKNGYANYTINSLSWDMNLFNKSDSYKKLYHAIAVDYWNELELEKNLSSSVIMFDAFKWIEKIKTSDALDYMFDQYNNCGDGDFFKYTTTPQFPSHLVKYNERVILYGGGQIGLRLYVQNLICNFCEIIAWVDREHGKLPHPIESIDILNNITCDKIMIAIKNKFVINEIKLYLINIGFKEDQIIVAMG